MTIKTAVFSLLLPLCIFVEGQRAQGGGDYSEVLFRRITGVPLSSRRYDYEKFRTLAEKKDWKSFAILASQSSEFINQTVLQWATVYYTSNASAKIPLDDALAMIVGSVRDNLDARSLLTGNYSYGPISVVGLSPNLKNNDAYELLEQRGLDLRSSLQNLSPQWPVAGFEDAAGLLTTRSFAAKNYAAGTNRRALRDVFSSFLCRPIETWRTPGLPVTFIHQDVDRAPGGNARVFQQECRTCHSAMDGNLGAFAHFNYLEDEFITDKGIQPKFLQHAEVYPEGHATLDDSWVNFLAKTNQSTGTSFGWRGVQEGHGINEFGKMVANSQSFSRCLVKRTYAAMCNEDLELRDLKITQLADQFESADGYGLRDLFLRVVLHPDCIKKTPVFESRGN